ncbi:MAG: hypothetical protein JXB10_03085 [Pirellulales bacterium]|nr:hypothetical protein [Pirellulales bacterium]
MTFTRIFSWPGVLLTAALTAVTVTAAAEPAHTLIQKVETPPVLTEKEGKLQQIVKVQVQHSGPAAEAILKIPRCNPVRIPLPPGQQTLEFSFPALEKEAEAVLEIKAVGRTLAEKTFVVRPVRKWILYFLPHSHVDIGYTQLQPEVLAKQCRNLETAVAAARATAGNPPGAQFKWNTEGLWAVDHYLQTTRGEKQREFIEAVKSGRIELDAFYGNELTGLCRPEELVRLVACAGRLAKRCGVTIESAMISDVPGYTWGIVPVLAGCGVKYLSIGPNLTDRIGRTLAAWGDKPFYWADPSGKQKVLCWMAGTGYSTFHGRSLRETGERPIFDYLNKLDAAAYPYDLVQLRYSTGGDNGPPDPDVADYVKQWNAKYAYPKLVVATTTEMMRELERRYGDRLPVVRGDFTPYWEDGAASSARETGLNRAAAERLVQTEILGAMLDPKHCPMSAFSDAWRKVLLYDEHTWGAYNSITEPDVPFVKNQWKIKQNFALDADRQSKHLLAEMLSQGASGGALPSFYVYNTANWPRTDLVILSKEQSSAGDGVLDVQQGRVVPSQRLSTGELAFLASDVPPLGAKRFLVQAGAEGPPDQSVSIEKTELISPKFRVSMDPQTGNIRSCRDLILDRELVDSENPVGWNSYYYVVGSDVKGARTSGPATVRVMESGPLVAALKIESDAPGCNRLTREVRLIGGLDRVDLLDVVDKKPVRAKEGVHFGFAFRVPGGVVRMETPWAVVRPEEDQLPGACKNWFTVQRWIDVSNRDFGVTTAVLDAPLVEVGGMTANIIGNGSEPGTWIEHLAPSQTLYSWVMNNHWHTNYRAEQEGPTEFRYALRPHTGGFDGVAAARFGIERSQPLLVGPAAADAPALRPSRLRVNADEILVTAFKPDIEGKALIVRLYNVGSEPVSAVFSWSEPVPTALWRSDLWQQRGRPICGPVVVPPHGFVTIGADLP